MKNTAGRPGVMLYFDITPLMRLLSEAQRGALVLDILEYAENGTEPDYGDDRELAIAWTQIRPKLDRDGERYYECVMQRRFAVYSREEKRHGREHCSFEEWKREYGEAPSSADIGCYPTTASATATASASASTSATASASESIINISSSASGKGECERGNLPFGETLYGGYTPLSEDEFEQKRRQKLDMLCPE